MAIAGQGGFAPAKQVVADYRKAMHDLKGLRKPLDQLPYHPRVVESAMEVLLELSRSGQLPEIPEDWVRFELMTIKDALGEDTTPT